MTNSIQKIGLNRIEAFENMRINNNSNGYWLLADKNFSQQEYDLANSYKVIMQPDEARKTKNIKIIGLSIAAATILTAAGIFFVLKGGPNGLSKGFAQLRQNIERMMLESNMNTGATPNKWLLYLSKAAEKISKHLEAVNNFTSFKDMLFTRLMNYTKLTGKIHDKISHGFERIGRKAVVSAYNGTKEKLTEANILSELLLKQLGNDSTYEIIEIGGVKMTKVQWLTKAQSLNDEIMNAFNANFDGKALSIRYFKMKSMVEKLYEQFRDMKIFLSLDSFKKFLAESTIAEQKLSLQKEVISSRRELSYTLKDMASASNSIILDIAKILGFKDFKNLKNLGEIRGKIYRYAQNPKENPLLKQKIVDDISLFRQEIDKCLQNKSITNEQAVELYKKINQLEIEYGSYKEGSIQQLLNIYKKLLPQNDYEKAVETYSGVVKSLDKSIKIENEDFMSKLRDLRLGSAPTDILTILGSFAVLGYNLNKSEDNAQKQSIALKYGFPALAGIGVSLYCNAKLYAGSKSLMFGAISTWLLNRIGEYSDNKLQAYKAKHQVSA
jgi:hypothetical protein